MLNSETYQIIMDIIETEKHEELAAAKKCRYYAEQAFNPADRNDWGRAATRYSDHAAGMEIVIQKLKRTFGGIEP